MAIYKHNLPDDLLEDLSGQAHKLSLSQEKIIEDALRIYLKHLKKAEYIQSYRKASEDDVMLTLAEEGMEDYYKEIEKKLM